MAKIDYITIRNCESVLSLYKDKKEIQNLKYVINNMKTLCEKYGVEELPIDDSLLFNLLLVFNNFIYDDKMDYVKYRLGQFRYSILDNDISTGRVCKIQSHGSLSRDGWAREFLYMIPNSSILEHTHNNEIEIYNCLEGSMVVNGESEDYDIVTIGESHNIGKVNTLSIIETYKLASDKLTDESIENMNTEVEKLFVKTLKRAN